MNMRKLLIVVAATPAFVTGTQNLMNDAMTWVLILIPIAASLFCALKEFCYQAADDNERIMINKSVKGAELVAILGECEIAIIKLILSYYGS